MSPTKILIIFLTIAQANSYLIKIFDEGRKADISHLVERIPICENCDGNEKFSKILHVNVSSTKPDLHLHTVPAWLFEQFENVEFLRIMNGCNLSFIQNEEGTTFQNAKKLKKIDFSGNLISEMAENSFNGAYNLKEIELSDNQIETVHENSLKMLGNLTKLDWSRNLIANLSKEIFFNNPKLKKINLDYNFLKTLDPDIFTRNPELETIDLFNNRLSENITLHFDVYNLKSLRMGRNEIVHVKIDRKSCGSRSGLETLSFIYNQLTNYSLSTCRENVTLDFKIHKMVQPGYFQDPLAVKGLIFSFGPLWDVKSLSEFRNLRYLQVKDTHIESFNKESFEAFERLESLFLSHNKLGNFDLNVLRPLKSLKSLELVKTNRTMINFLQLKTILPNLKYISVKINPLDCETLCQIPIGKFRFEINFDYERLLKCNCSSSSKGNLDENVHVMIHNI